MIYFCFFFLLGVLILFLIAYRYRNPYKLIMIFGKKGSGKSTLLTKLALQYIKAGRPVYASVPVPGAYLFDPLRIGFDDIPRGAVIFIDEVGMIWDSRDFKGFKKEYRDYFKLQRHYHHTVYLFSQSFDIDKKLRDLTDQMYLVRCYFNVFSIARRINKNITIVHADSGTGESHLADDMQFDSLLLFWAGSIKLTYVPRYVKYFDSFDAPVLRDATYQLVPAYVKPYKNRREFLLYVLSCVRYSFIRLCVSLCRYIQSRLPFAR